MSFSFWITNSEIVRVSGESAAWYLDGQLSVLASTLEEGHARRALLLEPDGSFVAPITVVRCDLGYDLFTPLGAGEEVKSRLEMFRLRTKVSFEVHAGCVIGVVGDGIAEIDNNMVSLISVTGGCVAPYMTVGDSSVTHLYCRRELDDVRGQLKEFHLPVNSEFTRILAGQPAWGREIIRGMNPTELGQAYIRSRADFQKGCYTGQELIERVDSRGYNSPRRMTNFILLDIASTLESMELGVISLEGKPVYTLTSYEYSKEFRCGIALGFAHRRGGEFKEEIAVGSTKITAVELGLLPSKLGNIEGNKRCT